MSAFGRGLSDELGLELAGVETTNSRIRKLEARLAGLAALAAVKPDGATEARGKLDLGQAVDRREAAAFLGVSTKKIQRMEAAGTLTRCLGLGTLVRYAARDVLRLASAR